MSERSDQARDRARSRGAAAWRLGGVTAFILATSSATAQTGPDPQSDAPPSPSEAAAAFDDRGAAAAAFFVLEGHLDPDASVEEMRERYADRVLYYGRGFQDRSVVLTDKSYYMRRWPTRRLAPDLSTLVVAAQPGGAYEVSIEYDFSVRNDAATVSGRARLDLTLEPTADGFLIARENGAILARR